MVRDHVLIMNTKTTKIHDYSAAQIMLRFEPIHVHFDAEPLILPDLKQTEQAMPPHQYQIFSALRDENRLLASEAASYTHGYPKQLTRKQRIPTPEDMILIRNHSVDKQHSRKLKAKWLEPRILIKYTKQGRSA